MLIDFCEQDLTKIKYLSSLIVLRKFLESHSFFFLIFLFLIIPLKGWAQKSEPVTLDTLIVTAQKSEETFETGDVDLDQTPAFFSIIKKEEFAGKMEDLAKIIEKEAGIQVRQNGGLGSFSSISLRGSSSEQVLIFLDGILLNDASGGGVDLSNIALADVEAIEIYRGTTPINFGKASIGGVVNIRTQRSKKGLKANIGCGYGSFNTRQLSGYLNHKPGQWDYLISADYLGSDNDFKFINNNGTQYNKDDDQEEKRNNAQFEQQNVLAKLGFDFNPDARIDLANQWFYKEQGLPSWNNSEKTETLFTTQRNISTLKLTLNDIGPWHINTSSNLNYTNKIEEYDDSHGHVGLGKQLTRYYTTSTGAGIFIEWLTQTNSLTLMADARKEIYNPDDKLKDSNPNDSSRVTYTTGLQDSLYLLQSKLIITPALRYSYIKDELESGTSIWGINLEKRSREKTYTSPQIGIKYTPLTWLAFKSNLASYVREPSFFELFGDRGFFVGNMDLKAEQGVNFDVGAEINLQSTPDWLNRFSMHGAFFKSEVENMITRVYDARGIGKADNISKARIQGIEGGIQVELFDFLNMIANATWQKTENINEIKAFDGKELPGRYKKSYLARLEALYKGAKFYTEYNIQKGMYYDTANLLEAEDKYEINAGVSCLYKSFLISFGVKNIKDEHYEDFNGYPMPGRSYFGSVKFEF